jgi:hypothetical protein
MLPLSTLAAGRVKDAFMPAFARLYCILMARDLQIEAFVFGLCSWSANFGRLFPPNSTNFTLLRASDGVPSLNFPF